VAVVANRGDGDEGYIGERLEHHGARISRFERDDPASLVRADIGADLLLLLGSDWSVYDEDHSVSASAERELVLRAQRADIPVLGICYGGQLISSALGLRVTASDVPEVGWRRIVSREEAVIPSGPWFQYHFDRWWDGSGVNSVAFSDAGPQAYWYGKTLALQFHPEVTIETIQRWCDEGRDQLRAIGEDIDKIMRESSEFVRTARERCFSLVDHFLRISHVAFYPRETVGSH